MEADVCGERLPDSQKGGMSDVRMLCMCATFFLACCKGLNIQQLLNNMAGNIAECGLRIADSSNRTHMEIRNQHSAIRNGLSFHRRLSENNLIRDQ